MQTLLALSFKNAGFQVVKNSVGVPDIQVARPDAPPAFAIEAKTGERSITISKRDLTGVISSKGTPVVAAFFLSDPTPRWWLVDARALNPGSYRRYEIQSKPAVGVGFDVTAQFSTIIASSVAVAMEGPGPLARLLGS